MSQDKLFQSGHIGALTLANRAVLAPMTRISARQDGVPTPDMARYYARFAQGGFGLIITEAAYTDQLSAQTYAYQSGLANDDQARGWQAITQAIHDQGGHVFVQLQHGGALAQIQHPVSSSVAPSAIQPKGEQLATYRGTGPYPVPVALEEPAIETIIQGFEDAANRAIQRAGFDGIELHGANGYLIDQFFTDYTNQRNDHWNGDIVQRLGLALRIIQRVRQRIGDQVPLGIRISQGKVNDLHHQWQEGEDGARRVFQALNDSGIDFLHITEYRAWQPAFADNHTSLAALARRHAPDLALIVNGSLGEPAQARDMLDETADFVAIGKTALANPDWPQRIRRGQSLRPFDPDLLSPLADIKTSELTDLANTPDDST